VVACSEFWDMAEQGEFFEIIGSNDGYYGIPHINKENIHDQYMVVGAEIATSIKKRYPKCITIYVLPEEKLGSFKINSNYQEAKKLDFLVVDNDLITTTKKIEEIVSFIEENGMKSS